MPFPSRGPISWSAPGAGQGIDPGMAAARFHFFRGYRSPYGYGGAGAGGRLSGSPQDQMSQATQQVLQAVGNYMKQRDQDQLANSLLSAQNAPGYLQGKGQMGLNAYNQLQANQAESTQQEQMGRLREAQIANLQDQGDPAMNDLDYRLKWQQVHNLENQPAEITYNVPGYGPVPASQLASVNHNLQLLKNYQTGDLNAKLANYGQNAKSFGTIAFGQPFKDTKSTPAAVQYVDASGNPLSNEQALANPGGAFARVNTVSGKTAQQSDIPLPAFFSLRDQYVNAMRNPTPMVSPARTPLQIGPPTRAGQNTNQADINQADINQAAAALNNQAALPTPDYSNSIPGAATQQTPPPVTDAFGQARAAIAAGADPDAVKARLQQAGYDTSQL